MVVGDCKRTLQRELTVSMMRTAHLSDSYLKDVVLNFMIAGRDTTAQVDLTLLSNRAHWTHRSFFPSA